ncbi:MAG: nucleotide-binding protein [Alphaproteobacteria bacterium]|nr:nucleotide-binding protein [Alphaproteobacteria bacterium]
MSDNNEKVELLIPKGDAEKQLLAQIVEGNNIKSCDLSSEKDLISAQREFRIWEDYNLELLDNIFSQPKFVKEYQAWTTTPRVSLRERNITEKIDDFKKNLSDKIGKLESVIKRLKIINESSELAAAKHSTNANTIQRKSSRKVFIVHGHDNDTKTTIARFLEKMELEPIILHEQASRGKTIIEKIEQFAEVDFGVIIYTPCDEGKSKKETELKDRARQNVVFEHGYLIGKLGRGNICALLKGEVERPGDIDGVIYIPMDNDNWKLDLLKEMRAAGLDIDFNKL